MKPYAFGIDLGGTTVKIGIFETNGTLKKSWEIPTRKEDQGSRILPDIAEAVLSEIKKEEISVEDIEGIGIDVPGPVLEDHIVNGCVNLGWGIVDVREELQKLTGIENVKVANDANAAALGEMWQGGGKGHENVVMITLGTGVGSGIIYHGQIISGCFGAAGEVGHMQVNPDETLTCGCGGKGHLEQYASATGIVRVGKKMLAETEEPSALRELPEITAKDVFDQAKKGDTVSIQIVDYVTSILGRSAAMISCVFDPEIYVFGGGVSKAGSILTDKIAESYREAAFHASTKTQFALATLGNDAGMYGAVKMVIED